ncbi:MAG: hypothetical protein NVSMB27_21390 [Ktedonobacteraceae bacterium]
MVGVAVGCGLEAAGDVQLASTTSSNGMNRNQRWFIQCIAVLLVLERKVADIFRYLFYLAKLK